MFIFDMSITENFAAFHSKCDDRYVFVESFDNNEFCVRIGSLSNSKELGKIIASSSKELNEKLSRMCNKK